MDNEQYKLRAECLQDWHQLAILMIQYLLDHQVVFLDINGHKISDVEVVFTSPLDLLSIQDYIRKITDGHVMLQTVQPIAKYTGDRDYDLE